MKHFLLEFLENLPLLNRYEAKAACDDILGYLEPLADNMADEVPALLLADPTAQHYDPDRGFWVAPHSKQWFWWSELNGYESGTLNLFLPERISNILQDSTANYPLLLVIVLYVVFPTTFFLLCVPPIFVLCRVAIALVYVQRRATIGWMTSLVLTVTARATSRGGAGRQLTVTTKQRPSSASSVRCHVPYLSRVHYTSI